MGEATRPRRRPGPGLALAVAIHVAVATVPAGGTANANWLSKLVREAGEAGGKGVSRSGHGALDAAALHLKSLPGGPDSTAAFAAHVTPEGHWTFANRAGEVYTAGTADEMSRVVAALAPGLAGQKPRLVLYLSDETVFSGRALLKDLPADAELHVVLGRASHPLVSRTEGGAVRLYAEVRPNVALRLDERHAVEEAMFQLGRPLEATRMRVLALRPGGPDSLKTVPRYDAATKGAMVDEIDPASLGRGLSSLGGQTAVLSGRVEAGQLFYRPSSGAERQIPLDEIERAAARADVNLVILQSTVASQPGGRNWLWQRVAVDGLDEALKRATVADFLNALGASRGRLQVEATRAADGRATLKAQPEPSGPAVPYTGALGAWMAEMASHVTGNLVTSAVEIRARGEERQRELDRRLVPGIPSWFQFGYLASLVAGMVGLPFSRAWWARIWPQEARSEYRGAIGHGAARLVRGLAFVLLFLPVAGVPAVVATVAVQLWTVVTAPWRLVRWLGALAAQRGRAA